MRGERPRIRVKNPASYVKSRLEIDSALGERGVLDPQWFASIAYFVGRQNIELTSSGGLRRRRESGSVQINKYWGAIERALSKIMKTPLGFKAAPRTDSIEDARAARTAEQFFDHLRSTKLFKQEEDLVELWAVLTGTGIAKVHWDMDAGAMKRSYYDELPDGTRRPLPDLEVENDPLLRNMLETQGWYEDTPQGDVVVESVSPFTFRVDPAARAGLEEAEWVVQEQYELVSKVALRYGLQESEIETDNGAQGSERYRRHLRELTSEASLIGTGSQDRRAGRFCRVIEYWEKPMKMNRNRGRLIVMVGNKVVRNGENPYVSIGTSFPFVVRRYSKVPDRFWGHGLGELLRGPQRYYNESRQAALDYQKKHAFPVFLMPKGTGVRESQLKHVPGVVLEYNPALGRPEFSPQPAMPPQLMQNAAAADAEMTELSAQAPPHADGVPGQLRSGAGVSLVQEANDLIMERTMRDRGEFLCEVGRQALRIMGRQYVTRRQMSRLDEKTREWEFASFAGADLRGFSDLVVLPSMVGGPSDQEQRGAIPDLIASGVLDPKFNPEDKAIVLEAFRLGGQGVVDRKMRHVEVQEAELEKMLADPEYMPMIGPWQDHAQHAMVLERLLNSPRFERLSDIDRQRVIYHWQEHTNALQEQSAAMMQMQQAMGGGQEKGTPSRARQTSTPVHG